MILASEINISLSYSPFILIIGILLSIAFSIWIYKVTLPQISLPLKIFLTAIRSTAIIMILLAIFEPVISSINKQKVDPETLLFVDNSQSMKNYISSDSAKIINEIKNLSSSINGKVDLYSFGSVLSKYDNADEMNLSFEDSLTNISLIKNEILKKKDNTASIILVSDGNFNSGTDPSQYLSKLGIPIYSVGVGDTVETKDIELRKVLANKFLYKGSESVIKTILLNKDLSGKSVSVILRESNNLVERKEIQLSENGINFVDFNYKPESSGEIKLSIEVSPLKDESNKANNRKSFFINVIDNKLNIAIVSAAPSADDKFVYYSLKEDEDLEINRSIQISQNKFLNDFNNDKINDADILYLIGFPGKNTPQSLFNIILEKLKNNTPFLIIVNDNTDLTRLKSLSQFLPFDYQQIRSDYSKAFVNVTDFNSPLLGSNLEERALWNQLPPVLRSSTQFSSKPQANTIAKIKIGNTAINEPLITTNNAADQKSIAILAGEIWRWKLSDKQNSDLLFDNFINTSVKWLRDDNTKKKFIIYTDKKIYSTAETVFATAELYDEALNPIPNAEINAELISSDSETVPFRFNFSSDGIYEYNFTNLSAGTYSIKAEADLNGNKYDNAAYNFSVENINLEKNTSQINFEFLNNLSSVSNGKFSYLHNTNNILMSVNNTNNLFNKEKVEKTEFRFWSNELVLIFIILLLASEWFVRKRAGMM